MEAEKLMQILDIESGSDFTYFENFAGLVESDEDIGEDAIAAVLSDVDMKVFAELAESYFYDIMEHMPDDAIDVYNILEAEKRSLIAIAVACGKGEEGALSRLANEIERFRRWYSIETNCVCIYEQEGRDAEMSLRDAIAEKRLSGLQGRDLAFDLSGAGDFQVDEYIVELGELS